MNPNPEPDQDQATDQRPAPRFSGLQLVVPLLGFVLAGYLLFDQRRELAYWAGAVEQVDLGAEGAYHFERASNNALATIRGQRGPATNTYEKLGKRYAIVPLRGTPILVRRQLKPSETRLNVTALEAKGRLLRDDAIPEYRQAFTDLVGSGGAVPLNGHLFVLLDGQLPRGGFQAPIVAAGLLLLIAANGWTLVRSLRRTRSARRP